MKVLETPWLAVLILMIAGLVNPREMSSQGASSLALMPMPAHVTQGDGQFVISGSLSIGLQGYKDSRVASARSRFLDVLSRETGIPFYGDAKSDQVNFIIKTAGASDAVQSLGEDESYHLEISTNHVELTAPNALGAMHGFQTFLQLVRITPTGLHRSCRDDRRQAEIPMARPDD